MVLYPLPCSRKSSYHKEINKREVTVVSDIYFNALMKISEEITF